MATEAAAVDRIWTVALVGQPNSGKTTLFNRLTGSRQKVGNYAGVTVERRIGTWMWQNGRGIRLIDLPGLYELNGSGAEEWIAATSLLTMRDDTPPPDAAIIVVDVTTVERGLHLVGEVMALGVPCVVALNMADLAHSEGVEVDVAGLCATLGVPVVTISARQATQLDELEATLAQVLVAAESGEPTRDALRVEAARQFLIGARLRTPDRAEPLIRQAAPELLDAPLPDEDPWLAEQDRIAVTVERWAEDHVTRGEHARQRALSQRLDDVMVHPVYGLAIFLAIMFLIFQSVYAWSDPMIGWIELGMEALGAWAEGWIGGTMVGDLLINAGLYGAGNVVVFLPQILILFLWIAVLEESGYLARVAFMVDRPMRSAGMSGKSFIPLLSSFACAVPGIMAARTIESPRARLITILAAPLMTCSARLPVYTLLIGAFVPERTVLGALNVQGVVLFALYLAGVVSAFGLARLISARLDRGIPIPMILELPIYRWPDWRNVIMTLWDRAKIFLRRAGTIIFAMSIVLWFMLSFPRDHQAEAELRRAGHDEQAVLSYRIQHSAAGIVGHAIEPVLRPLGYDWKIGISLIASFAAREVMVATLGTIYNVAGADEDSPALRDRLRADPAWDLATALSVLVWYIYALQCMSTVAIMKRELGTWRWPVFALGTTYGIAWLAALATYQLARLWLS